MRALGIDLGTKRIGVAISDSGGALATPYEVIARSGDVARDRRRILELADEIGAEAIVVGLPRSMDGSLGPAARGALDEVEALRALTELPIETYDERLSTVSADRALMMLDLGATGRRKVVDKVAAAVILQAWLDRRRNDLAHEPDVSPPTAPTAHEGSGGTDHEGLTVGPLPSRRPRSRRRRPRG